MITLDKLKSQLDYNPETGDFVWKISKCGNKGICPGKVAGQINPNGYRYITVNQNKYLAHRLAWFFVHGEFPKDDVDHINRERDDNRIKNLRDVARVVNLRNTGRKAAKSGFAGVRSMGAGFRANINIGGTMCNLGKFPTAEEAHEAFKAAHVTRHGANSGYYKEAA